MAPAKFFWRYRLAIGGAMGTFLTLAGLGGLSDDLAQWQDWLSFLGGDLGRWLFVLGGVTLFFLTFSNRIELAMPMLGRKSPTIPVSAMERTFLHYREHCGASWRPRITQDSTVIAGPYCPEDHKELLFRRPLEPYEIEAREARKEQEERDKASQGGSIAGLFDMIPRPLLSLGGADEEEFDTYKLRPLKGADRTASDETGPFCRECGRFRKMPKTVDECRLEVLREVKEDYGLS